MIFKRLQFNYILISTAVIISLSIESCVKDEIDGSYVPTDKLVMLNSFPLTVLEPSGLSLSENTDEFFTVSDNTNKIYRISADGNKISELAYTGNDLEGITFNASDSTIWVVEERLRKVLKTSISGNILDEYDIPVEIDVLNSGLEGISYNSSSGSFYILNEKNPPLLIEWSPSKQIINTHTLDFAKDYSGIFYDMSNNILWITSDESQTVSKCSLEGEVYKTYRHETLKSEGIIVNTELQFIYMVSDSENKLYKYSIPENNTVAEN